MKDAKLATLELLEDDAIVTTHMTHFTLWITAAGELTAREERYLS